MMHSGFPAPLRTLAVALVPTAVIAPSATAQDYEILAVRYGTVEQFPLRGLLPDAPRGEELEIVMAFWVVRSTDRVVLFDSGFFREPWLERFDVRSFVPPDRALARAGIAADEVTDIVVSHAHWDHMGGIELFPEAVVWIQVDEYTYYTGAAWEENGRSGGIDRADVEHLMARRAAGLVRLVQGDGVEIIPGITALTGARHTYASQYLLVGGDAPVVLASDNAYLYRNLSEGRAGATFTPEDREANLAALRRMLELAGDVSRVVPGHDPEQFVRFPAVADGVVRIRSARARDDALPLRR